MDADFSHNPEKVIELLMDLTIMIWYWVPGMFRVEDLDEDGLSGEKDYPPLVNYMPE